MSGRMLAIGLGCLFAAVITVATGVSVLSVTGLASSCPAQPGTSHLAQAGAPIPQIDDEQLNNARAIVDTGAELGVPAHGWVIAVAVALQESGLRSLDRGDRVGPDSRGLFQQRPAWGPVAERLDPAASARLFYTGGHAGQPGLLDIPGWADLPLTEAAQAVQHSAYPTAYAAQEDDAAAIVTILGSTVRQETIEGPGTCHGPCPATSRHSDSTDPAEACPSGEAVLARASDWLTAWNGGPVPYLASTDPHTWFGGYRRDCSGYASMALGLPKPGLTTIGLAAKATPISKSALRPGDLLINPASNLNGHVVIFDHWRDTTTTAYVGYEQSGDGGTHHRTIPYPYFGNYPMTPYAISN